MIVTACPRCGIQVLNHCFHDDESIMSQEMPVEQAISLLESTIEEAEFSLKACKNGLERYQEMADGVSNTREA